MYDHKNRTCVIPALYSFPGGRTQSSNAQVVRDAKQGEHDQRRNEPEVIGDAENIEAHAAYPVWSSIEEILDEIAAHMCLKPEECVEKREDAGNDAEIPAEEGRNRIGRAAQKVQGADD